MGTKKEEKQNFRVRFLHTTSRKWLVLLECPSNPAIAGKRSRSPRAPAPAGNRKDQLLAAWAIFSYSMAAGLPLSRPTFSLIEQNFLAFFPLFFVSLWLAVTTVLAVLSGWFRLMAKFPNQTVEPLLRIRGQSGSMGFGVSMQGILTFSVCPSGLRVGIMRVFGPFCRDFLVPWEALRVIRKSSLFGPVARLQFGYPAIGYLTIPTRVANRAGRCGDGAVARDWAVP